VSLYPLTIPPLWPDFQAIWSKVMPHAWPDLWREDSEPWRDIEAIGDLMGQARTWLEYILQFTLPERDIYGVFLDRWEKSFGIGAAGTIAERVAAIERKFRLRGLGKEDTIKAIFLTAFPGATSLDDIVLTRPDYEDLAGNTHDHAHRRAQNALHISSKNDAIDPDRPALDDLLVRTAPVWATWTGGRYLLAMWETSAAGWKRGVWQPRP
jgi:hypothetical protein